MKITNLTRGTMTASDAVRAESFMMRLRGMMFRSFKGFDAMVFDRCSAIHTCFMSIPLDVLFVSAEGRVLRAAENVPPWKFCVACRGARYVVELPSGSISSTRTETGDILDIDRISCGKVDFYENKVIFHNTEKVRFGEQNRCN